jgi:glycosyltransferase involved in cell wall biosynthesis
MAQSNSQPLVSILMSVYNERSDFLDEAIHSLLNQTYKNFELLITNDHSITETTKSLKAWADHDSRITLIHNSETLGLTRSLNAMLHAATGTFIARMDSDDISEPNRLAVQMAYLHDHPQVALCGSWAKVINEKGAIIGERKAETSYQKIRSTLMAKNPFIHSSWFARLDALKKVGGYNETMRLTQDYDLVLHLAATQPVEIIPEFLLQYREQLNSLSFTKMRTSLGFALRARWNALTRYGYPAWMAIYMIKPLISYAIPIGLKKWVYQLSHR